MKILYAEDSVSIAKHVQNVLESMGYHVTHVANGLEAVKAYRASPPDLVLMDVVMPVMDGIEATRQIKKMGGEKWVPLIIMTSLTGKRIEFLAHHDALTGLPNRARLGEVLSQAVAGRLQQVIGASHFVGRLGGDEFVVLLNNITTEDGALMWANQIIDAISKPMRFNNDITCLLGASIGVACIPKHGRSNTDILSHADAAMYEAKRAGKNRAMMTSGQATH